jgi:hypothetical protein
VKRKREKNKEKKRKKSGLVEERRMKIKRNERSKGKR